MNITDQDVEYLRNVRLHFGFPCYSGMLTEPFFVSILKFFAMSNRIGINFTIDTISNESLVPRARNSCVAKFLAFEPKSTHLMFIDVDIGFEPEEIIKLLLAKKDVIGGLYPKKSLPIQYVVNKVPDAAKDPANPNLVEVANLGTGFMLIKRDVIDTLIKKHPDTHYQDNIGLAPMYDPYKYNLFDISVDSVTHELLSEDYHFCKLWRAAGGKIWADLSIKLSHSGFYKFEGDATKLAPHL